MDDKDVNGLPLDMGGLEVLFPRAKEDAPCWLGAHRAEGTAENARERVAAWWRDNLSTLAGQKDQSLTMPSTTLWGCSADVTYPWLRSLAHYLLWHFVNLHLAFTFRDAYNAAVVSCTADEILKSTVSVLEKQVLLG